MPMVSQRKPTPNQNPFLFPFSLFNWARAGGIWNLSSKNRKNLVFIAVISAQGRQRQEIKSSRPCPSKQTKLWGLLQLDGKTGWDQKGTVPGAWPSMAVQALASSQSRMGLHEDSPLLVMMRHKTRPPESSSSLVCCLYLSNWNNLE